ncbi:exodeoxyribonuclease V subunit alpha [Alteromonas sp. ASW11-130]|uniref:exodeoxyribonuclease V subunit alpha n=1 Tax=Alteromonas sp. ASW11-130 TaxID=3015775 RepID=UPI00224222EE|nr:exodeoxyribonuclease V subunit alpha [Alteromonas sp. ASW11-130]MCW8090258.1 exodeoxyribonuclease V subunit alpha [Alteromonas sp. ASW11-130]
MKLTEPTMPTWGENTPSDIEPIDWYTANALTEGADLDEVSLTVWRNAVVLLSIAQRQGHTCLDLVAIAGTTIKNCDDYRTEFRFPEIDELKNIIVNACSKVNGSLVILDGTRLYTQRYWSFERELACAIHHRQQLQLFSSQQYEALKHIWPLLFPNTIQTEDWQQVATAASLNLPFCIVNGGPGTGKTYTVARILLALQCVGEGMLTIQLAAPTGKAAQRLGESITQNIETLTSGADSVLTQLAHTVPTKAVTLHRLLGITSYQVKTKRHHTNPLDCDVLIIDEASMVDLALMVRTVRALKPDCKLILVGDADQLPAIESGNVLEALVGSQRTKNTVNPAMLQHIQTLNPNLALESRESLLQPFTFTLQKAQRFGGNLATVAQLIQAGDSKEAWQQLTKINAEQIGSLFKSQSVTRLSTALFTNKVTTLIQQSFNPLFSASSVQEALLATQYCRWLTPVKKGALGVERLNQQIETLARQKVSMANLQNMGQFSRFYAGQPIMVLENNYANQLYNGDVGVVWPDEKGNLKAWFEADNNSLRGVSLSRLPAVQTAYVMTVHKSQGSEFAHVVMILPASPEEQRFNLNTRELVYTGLTRAKQSCLFVSEQEAFLKAVQTRQQRFSGLAEHIKQQIIAMKEKA